MRIMLLFIFISLSHMASAQRVWTLQQCIDSAILNNNGINLSELDLSISEMRVNSNKLLFLPKVNANAAHGYNWGQTIDPFTNDFATQRVQYDNFFLSSSMTLFSGLTNHYRKEIGLIDYEISKFNLEIEKRNKTLDVLTVYLQVKLNNEIIELRRKHISFLEKKLEKEKVLEDLNYQVSSKSLELKAQKAKEEYELTLAINDYKKSSFLLQNVIGRVPDSAFAISDSIELQIDFDINEYDLAQLKVQKMLFETKETKGRLLPTISINGSLGSGYSANNRYLNSNGDFVPKPFTDQLNENLYQSLSATISIPIFNGVESYAQIKINELELEKLKVNNEQTLIDQQNKLLEYKLDIENQEAALQSAQKALEVYLQLFEESKIKYENNAIDYYSFIQTKDDLLRAESEVLQVKYRLIFAEFVYMLHL